MSKPQNNKELVRVGHEVAKAMSADTPIIEIAKMMSRLAERLDCTTVALHATQAQRDLMAAENAALKSNLMFWDAEEPDAPYDTPEEIAEACSLNYNEEFIVQVANKLPNRTYRVCECWEHECRLELVEGSEVETPATDAYLAEVRASAITEALHKASDYLDTDCVMDLLDISYEEAGLRSAGAIDLHHGLVAVANQLRQGAVS